MQTVSSAYLAAMASPERRFKARVDMTLFGSELIASGFTTSASSTLTLPEASSTLFGTDNAFDTFGSPGYKMAVAASDGTVYPATDIYPVQTTGFPSPGWWSSVMSDNTTGLLSPTQTLTIDYTTSKVIASINVVGDATLGWPVDFTVDRSADNSAWTNVVTITGNALATWSGQVTPTQSDRYLRLSITRWSIPNRYPVIFEFSNGWTVSSDDALGERIKSIEITRESHFEDETVIPVGNYAASTCTIVLANEDGVFYQRNAASPYAGYLKPNKKVRVSLGLYVGVGQGNADLAGYEWVPMGVFYTLNFKASLNSTTATIECWDRIKKMQEQVYEGTGVLQNQTLSGLATSLMIGFGLVPAEYDIMPTAEVLDYSYFDRQTFWEHLVNLAIGETGYIHVTVDDVVHFSDRYFYWSTRLTAQTATALVVRYTGSVRAADTVYVYDGTHTDTYTVVSVSGVTVEVTPSPVRTYATGVYVTKDQPVLTLTTDSALTDASDEFNLDKMKNHITINTNPLTLAKTAAGVLVGNAVQWQLQDAFSLAPTGDQLSEAGGNTGSVISNLVLNPSPVINATGYTGTNATVARSSTAGGVLAGFAVRVTSTNVASGGVLYSPGTVGTGSTRVTTGLSYTASCYVRLGVAGSHSMALSVNFYNAAGTFISTVTGSTVALNTTDWSQRFVTTALAPALAVFCVPTVYWVGAPGVFDYYVDELQIEAGITATPFNTNMVYDRLTLHPKFQNVPILVDGIYVVAAPATNHYSNVSVLVAPVTGHDANGNPTVGTLVVDPLRASPSSSGTSPMDNTVQLIQKVWLDADGVPLSPNYPLAWGGTLSLINTSSTEYRVIQVTIDGFQMTRASKQAIDTQDATLIALYGDKTYTLDSPFVTNANQARSIGANLLDAFKDPSAPIHLSLPVRGLPPLELGDRIVVQSPLEGMTDLALNNHFYVVRHTLKFDGGVDSEIDAVAAI